MGKRGQMQSICERNGTIGFLPGLRTGIMALILGWGTVGIAGNVSNETENGGPGQNVAPEEMSMHELEGELDRKREAQIRIRRERIAVRRAMEADREDLRLLVQERDDLQRALQETELQISRVLLKDEDYARIAGDEQELFTRIRDLMQQIGKVKADEDAAGRERSAEETTHPQDHDG